MFAQSLKASSLMCVTRVPAIYAGTTIWVSVPVYPFIRSIPPLTLYEKSDGLFSSFHQA